MIAIPNPNSRVVTICFRHEIHLAILQLYDIAGSSDPPAPSTIKFSAEIHITIEKYLYNKAVCTEYGQSSGKVFTSIRGVGNFCGGVIY